MPPTFALIDGERLVRDSLATCLVAGAPGARIAYAGPSAIEAAAALHGAPEPCALVRDSGGRAQALEAIGILHRAGVPSVVVVSPGQLGLMRAVVAAGAEACVSADAGLPQLGEALGTVLAGGRWFPDDLEDDTDGAAQRVQLSPQERRTLVLYASGMTLGMVATRLDITEHTAKHYLDRVREKATAAGVPARTKVELHELAKAEGYLP